MKNDLNKQTGLALAPGLPRVLIATTALLAFISFWRAAAVVLNDMGSSAFYAGAIAEIKLPKYENLAGYAQNLAGNIERYCDFWNRGI